ncbi:heavy-metal-associated domain-containing protein [Desertivirga xinjiangensis]|uniref:heavy-metal-associated domain-containing protein n=1 Tax=Desertivirga xinjiangensis TaxID=539206 RepID=UPI0021096A75|nr:hypothetical protein [Pedobacter xinjiangensis]
MENLKFKTTIKCGNCLNAVTPALNETVGENYWNVDLLDPSRILSVSSESTADADEIIAAVKKAGFEAEKI